MIRRGAGAVCDRRQRCDGLGRLYPIVRTAGVETSRRSL